MTPSELITQTFELAAGRCEDMTPLVYDRLFRQQPQMQAQFVRDTGGHVKGEMLARVIEAILDFIGPRRYASALIQCEVVTHAGYDVPPEVFAVFFSVVADTLQDLLGDAWSPAMETAWRTLLRELDHYVTHPDQSLSAAHD